MRFLLGLRAMLGQFPLLCLGFVLALALTVVFSLRLFQVADRWADPVLPDEPLAGWMTPRYAAQAMHVPPEVVIAILHLNAEHHRQRATLRMIAAERGIDEAAFLRDLEQAIRADRAAHGTPPPRLPPDHAPMPDDTGPPPPPLGAPR